MPLRGDAEQVLFTQRSLGVLAQDLIGLRGHRRPAQRRRQ
jgi:hypothetical protein